MPILRRHEDPRDDYCGGKKERGREEIFIKEAERSTATQLKREDPKIHEIVHNNVLILLTSR